MHRLNAVGLLLLLSLTATPAPAQTAAPASDPNAVALANQALQALAGGTALTDITLQGNVAFNAGSGPEAGTATMIARANTQSAVTVILPEGPRKELRNGSAGVWVGLDQTPHAMAASNCYLDASWFFPAFSLAALSGDPTLIVTLAGQETRNGQQVYHLTLLHSPAGQSPDVTSFVQQASKMDLYLDATTLRPAALDFNVHPENNPNFNIATEIRFSGYQSTAGVWAPGRVQKYVLNLLVLDFAATNLTVNSGIGDSAFALPAVQPTGPPNSGTPSGAGTQ